MGLFRWLVGGSELFARLTPEEKRAALDLDDFFLRAVLDARRAKARLAANTAALRLAAKMSDEDLARALELVNLNRQAQQASSRGDHRAAVACFEKVVAEAPFDSIALMSLGVQYAFLGDRARAIEYLERAARADPSNRRIRDNLEAVRRDPT